jgi:DNA-binding PadR family transcriptional regulator
MGLPLGQLGRFAGPAQQILNVLSGGPRAPHAIRREVDVRCGANLGPGTLFGALARLERLALIEVVASPAAPRAYRLTALGAESREAQLEAVAHQSSLLAQSPNRSPAR